MSVKSTDQTKQLERAGNAGPQSEEVAMQHSEHHSMIGHLLMCGLGMLAAVVVGAVLGINVAALFCAAMMLSMIWMMAAPAIAKRRHRDQANH